MEVCAPCLGKTLLVYAPQILQDYIVKTVRSSTIYKNCNVRFKTVLYIPGMRGCTISDAATTLILNTIIRRRYLGISPDVPAASCAEIKSVRSEVTTGVYWTLNAVGMPALVFCQYL